MEDMNALTSQNKQLQAMAKELRYTMGWSLCVLLPPASEGWGKVVFSQVSVCPQGEGEGLPREDRGTPLPRPGPGWLSGADDMSLAFTQEDFLVYGRITLSEARKILADLHIGSFYNSCL